MGAPGSLGTELTAPESSGKRNPEGTVWKAVRDAGRAARLGGEGSLRLRAEHARVGHRQEGPQLTSQMGEDTR